MYKRIFWFFVVLCVALSSTALASEPNLVGWWKLDGNANDSSGNGLDGTAQGDPNWITGYKDGAIDLWPDDVGTGGINDWVDLPVGNLISTLKSSTFAIWVYFRSAENGNWPRIWDFGNDETTNMFLAPRAGGAGGTGATRFALTLGGSGAETQVSANSPNNLPANGWHHIAISFKEDTNDIFMYIDGVIRGQNLNATLRTPSVMGVTVNNWLGQSQYGPEGSGWDDFLDGSLDDFKIYNRYMTVDDVEAISDHMDAWLRSPGNGSTDANVATPLRWYGGYNRADVNGSIVYVSTRWMEVNDMNITPIIATDPCTIFNGSPDTTYYWRVVEVNGATTWVRDQIWSFRIDAEASAPQPAVDQGGILVGLTQVAWTPHGAATAQKIIFSKVFQDVNGPAAGASGTALAGNAGSWGGFAQPLEVQTTYYWRIDTQVGANWFRGAIWSFTTAFPMNFLDDFNTSWNYFNTMSTAGTIWTGVEGLANLFVMDTDTNSGVLHIDSSGYWRYIRGQGVFLYKEVDGPYIASVEVTDIFGLYPRIPGRGNGAGALADNQVGLMARLGDLSKGQYGADRDALDEDYVALSWYPSWAVGQMGLAQGWEWRMPTSGTPNRYNEDRTEFGRMWTGWDDNPNPTGGGGVNMSGRFLQLEFKGHGNGLTDDGKAGRFYLRWSQNGNTWFNLASGDQPNSRGRVAQVAPLNRYGDMNNFPHQIGIFCSVNYSGTVSFAEFDNFRLGRELILKAIGPSPSPGSSVDVMKVSLQWTPGDLANNQDFYFGTSQADVAAADRLDPEFRGDDSSGVYEGVPNTGPDVNGMYTRYRYIEPRTYTIGSTYYWKVVERDDWSAPPIVWQNIADVWSFSVQAYSVVDSFDGYVSTGGPSTTSSLRMTWIDGYVGVGYTSWQFPNPPVPGGSSGSYAQISNDTADGNTDTGNRTYSGPKSMKLYYDNDRSIAWLVTLYNQDPYYTYPTEPTPNGVRYSEVSAAINDANRIVDATRGLTGNEQASLGLSPDWRSYKALRVPYYGYSVGAGVINTKTANDVLYVTLRDGDGDEARVNCPDTDAVIHQGWHVWYIAMQDFNTNNVDLNKIARIKIGVGNNSANGGRGAIFIDEIQLLTATDICAPTNPGDTEVTPVTNDWSFNCRTDTTELRMLQRNWLLESSGYAVLPDANCVIKLDASGLTLGAGFTNWANTIVGAASVNTTFRDPNAAISGRRPTVTMVDGIKAVMFDDNDILVSDVNAPASITGTLQASGFAGQGPFTAIYTIWNESFAGDETVFNWGKRGNTGKYATLAFSPSNAWGAGAYWGGNGTTTCCDITFENYAPVLHQWHTFIHIYKGGTNGSMYIITDGKMNTNRPRTLGIWPNCPMVLGGAYDGDPYIVKPWQLSYGYKGTLAIREIKIYNVAADPFSFLTGGNLPNLKTGDVPEIVDFKDIATFATTWMTIDYLTD